MLRQLCCAVMFSFVILVLFNTSAKVYAAESVVEEKIELDHETIENIVGVENITLDDLNDRIHTKTYELVKISQTFGSPFVIFCFIISILILIVGTISGGRGKSFGLAGIILCILAYVGIQNAHALVTFISKWIIS